MLFAGGEGGLGKGKGFGGRGRGHFHPPAIYCTTTWCFALKGLRTKRALGPNHPQPHGGGKHVTHLRKLKPAINTGKQITYTMYYRSQKFRNQDSFRPQKDV